jgi:hypothetical protein
MVANPMTTEPTQHSEWEFRKGREVMAEYYQANGSPSMADGVLSDLWRDTASSSEMLMIETIDAAWNRRPASPVGVSEVDPVQVKPLEWRYYPDAFPPFWDAATPFGHYFIDEVNASDSPVYDLSFGGGPTIARFDGLAETKEAAQPHFGARMRAALQAALSPKGEAPETTCADASDAITSLQTERDEAREYGAKARIRERDAEDARISAVDEASRLQSQLTEAREALRRMEPYRQAIVRIFRFKPDTSLDLGTEVAALTNLQPAGKDKL